MFGPGTFPDAYANPWKQILLKRKDLVGFSPSRIRCAVLSDNRALVSRSRDGPWRGPVATIALRRFESQPPLRRSLRCGKRGMEQGDQVCENQHEL